MAMKTCKKSNNFKKNCDNFKKFQKINPHGRLDLHNIWNDEDQRHRGLYPFPQEYEYELPKKDQSEDLFLFASSTTEKTTFEMRIRRRPLPKLGNFEPLIDKVSVQLNIIDANGDVYSLNEEDVVEFNSTEYKGCGLAYESLQPNKIARIKFRGYLQRNDETKLVYVRIRFLCLFFSKTFDHQRQFDRKFLAKELSDRLIDFDSVENVLENCIEQFCQIKGTFQVESQEERELFFLGSIGRRFFQNTGTVPRKVIKICGFNKEGLGFQFGFVKTDDDLQFRFGFISRNGEKFKLLSNISLKFEQVDQLPHYFKVFKHFKLIDTLKFDANFVDDNKCYKLSINPWKNNWYLVDINGIEGMCHMEEQTYEQNDEFIARDKENISDDQMVVTLDKDIAQMVELCGGKGASLARLKKLSKANNKWQVSNALIVTTVAHQLQLKELKDFTQKIVNLSKSAATRNETKKTCLEMVHWFEEQKLNPIIEEHLINQIEQEFGIEWNVKKFAVRSSATWEDSAEMSAAGLMNTYLGIEGKENLTKAIIKCWASQYGLVSVEYVRGYGQQLNKPMAVIIQEMIDCDAAGVAFTASPIDGDERFITINANFGLGESVVSAATDPDTFIVSVNIKHNSHKYKRSVNEIVERSIGKKTLVTRLNDSTSQSIDLSLGIRNDYIKGNECKQCISDEDLICLSNICLQIHQHYGNPRDIEWGVKSGNFFMFQSRPITNLDTNFTSYELMHEMDTPHMEEFEIYSPAHWGEIFPCATSWVGGFNFVNSSQMMRGQVQLGVIDKADYNPFKPGLGVICNHIMFNMKGSPFDFFMRDYPESDFSIAQVMGFFGRDLDDTDVLEGIRFMKENTKPPNWMVRTIFPIMLFLMPFITPRNVKKLQHRIFVKRSFEIVSRLKDVPLENMQKVVYELFQKSLTNIQVHAIASFSSTIRCLHLMRLLKNSTTNESDILHDYNLILSHCNDVESAEVPNLLREIASKIEDSNTFQELTDEDALLLLKTSNSKAAKLFAVFLERHGHRGFREFDPLYLTWEKNPIPCIQVIKSLLKSGSNLKAKNEKTNDQIISELKTPLNIWKKFWIKRFLLSWCRNGIRYRENSKSCLIKLHSHFRDAMWTLSEKMVEEGMLPEADLIFFLKIDETERLLNGEICPSLVMKARQRKRIYPQMDKLIFDEFIKGFRMAPRSPNQDKLPVSDYVNCLKGTAVTLGEIKARVCVAETIDQASNIQQGDILLTYSTDIGWSPYFPLLSGIVTEIGGTISHGAVIAREFGLPCLIAVQNVCRHFQTGDMAHVNCKTATISKIANVE